MNIQAYPAWGRKVTTQDQLRSLWEAGKDFLLSPVDSTRLMTGNYINKEDFKIYSDRYGITSITLKCGSVALTIDK